MLSLHGDGFQAAADRLGAAKEGIRDELRVATRENTQAVAASVRKRFFPAAQISVQDAPQGQKLSGQGAYHVSYSEDGLTGFVTLEPHITKVTSAVKNVVGVDSLARPGLWIQPSRFIRSNHHGYFAGREKLRYGLVSRDGLKLMTFGGPNKGLEAWAKTTNQLLRKAVFVTGGTLQTLSTGPALAQNEAAIKERYLTAVKEAVANYV